MMFIIKLLTILLACSSFIGAQEQCETPDVQEGQCVPVQRCTAIWNAITNKDHIVNPDVASYLRNSQCGVQANSQRVCCALEYIDSTGEVEDNKNATKPTNSQESRISLLTDNSAKLLKHRNSNFLNFQSCGYATNANVSEFKWIVNLWYSLESDDQIMIASKCIGVLISRRTLVAPAHCVSNLPGNIKLSYVKVNGQQIGIDKIDIHPKYNDPKFSNDIAMLRLLSDVNESTAVPICLPKNADPEQRTSATLQKESGLYQANIDFLENNECETTYNLKNSFKILPGQVCGIVKENEARSPKGGFNYEDGLIGVVIERLTSNNQYELMGFSSTAIKSASSLVNKPYIFTEMVNYLDFIMDTLEEKRERKACVIPDTRKNGFCVLIDQCRIIREAPKPLPHAIQYIVDNSACLTNDYQNGICCLSRYIDETVEPEIIENRFLEFKPLDHRSIKLLDLEGCGTVESDSRIVSGREAALNQFPWISLIKYQIDDQEDDRFECGATLISARYVLTAAHCLTNLPIGYKPIAVRFGEHDLNSIEDCVVIGEVDGLEEKLCAPPIQDIPIQHSLAHPSYDIPRFANDIGLVRLSRAPDMSLRNVAPICLPITAELQNFQIPKFKVAGFGVTESGYRSEVLLHITVPFVDLVTCQKKHGNSIRLSDGHFCAGGVGIEDACKGDSGGPIMFPANFNGMNKFVQFGVVAAGHAQCGTVEGFPGIYSNTSYYLQWILDNMTK